MAHRGLSFGPTHFDCITRDGTGSIADVVPPPACLVVVFDSEGVSRRALDAGIALEFPNPGVEFPGRLGRWKAGKVFNLASDGEVHLLATLLQEGSRAQPA